MELVQVPRGQAMPDGGVGHGHGGSDPCASPREAACCRREHQEPHAKQPEDKSADGGGMRGVAGRAPAPAPAPHGRDRPDHAVEQERARRRGRGRVGRRQGRRRRRRAGPRFAIGARASCLDAGARRLGMGGARLRPEDR